MTNVSIIVGAPNEYSRLNGILDFITKLLQEKGIDYETINVHTLPAEDLIQANFNSEAIIRANEIVNKSTGVVILTPVYKASYSGILKTFLDLLPQKGLEDKVILPLILGGTFGHLLTIQYALNPVLSVLGATTISNGVYTIDQHIERTGENTFIINEDAQQRLNQGIEAFLRLI
ncbi:NADPH-dependent FMN reductase [Metabacillus halosaccharovorans]|uniref:NADPH-dependent FMN reductase n=1 Tax=Metabacillus halosaccharovorans TaxID=930124 RepID=A0ABT3DI36_9BACI|nr:NADPH-dependent FMN reductase [Metabacillus halosaccharovorans]MCV9886725.1 NADPH-dependent FMN reductase [Metabacillus halosaccharovorans]